MSKVRAAVGAFFLAVGCVLGVVGLGTSSWEVRKPMTANITANGTAAGDVVMTRGLWEECQVPVTSTGNVPCRMSALSYDQLGAEAWVMRVLICVGNLMDLLSFAFVVIWMFGYSCRESYGWRTLVFTFSAFATWPRSWTAHSCASPPCRAAPCWGQHSGVPSENLAVLSAFLTIMPTLAYGLKILVNDKSDFTLGWSFGVAIAGAILLGPGNFFLCNYAHHLDDKDNLLYEKHNRSRQVMGEFQQRDQVDSSYM